MAALPKGFEQRGKVLVVYFDDAMIPVDPDDATLIKIMYPDGSVEFATPPGYSPSTGRVE